MPLSMKGQGWKNNIVVVEGRGGRRETCKNLMRRRVFIGGLK